MKKLALIFLLLFACGLVGQENLIPSDSEKLRLREIQRRLDSVEAEMKLLQARFSLLQTQREQHFVRFYSEAERIRKSHAWPEEAKIDPETLQFNLPPKPLANPKEE